MNMYEIILNTAASHPKPWTEWGVGGEGVRRKGQRGEVGEGAMKRRKEGRKEKGKERKEKENKRKFRFILTTIELLDQTSPEVSGLNCKLIFSSYYL